MKYRISLANLISKGFSQRQIYSVFHLERLYVYISLAE